MVSSFLRLNFWLESITESKPKEQRTFVSKVVLNGMKLICRYMVYWQLSLLKKVGMIQIKPLVDDGQLPIVSLTTFPARIHNLWMVIYGMYRQTIRPARIIVILTKEEMPEGEKSLPKSLGMFAGKGVEFKFVDENLFPHNKYFYVRQWFPERNVITIDDDLLYYSDTIERLVELNRKFPFAVCSNRIHVLRYDSKRFHPYKSWVREQKVTAPSQDYCSLGYSAVFYPAVFNHEELYQAELIKSLCLKADDLWLKAMELMAGIPVVAGGYYAHPLTLPSSQCVSLQSVNNERTKARNDIYWNNLNERFNLLKVILRTREEGNVLN